MFISDFPPASPSLKSQVLKKKQKKIPPSFLSFNWTTPAELLSDSFSNFEICVSLWVLHRTSSSLKYVCCVFHSLQCDIVALESIVSVKF